ncbi:MAG: cytochrome c peroxidase [Gammaproteobacteria bacterium]
MDTTTAAVAGINAVVSMQALGEKLYFDENLSSPVGQSCASCHLPEAGFADPDSHFPVSEGVISGRFGNRNTPTASYAAAIPELQFDILRNRFLGGQFLDGRANTLEEQAQGPFLNPLEMNNTKQGVIEAVRLSNYASDFEIVFGQDSLDDVDSAYEEIAQAIAEFERTELFSPFSAKLDAVQARTAVFTQAEQRGLNLFTGKADCGRCHGLTNTQSVLTDFSYHNLGVQANINNPFYSLDSSLNSDGNAFVDLGLGAVLNDARENGKFRVPTLRNVAITAPYMHNGVFDSLQQVIDFYNSRDTNPDQPPAEVDVNKDRGIGDLRLTQGEIDDLIAFLNTFTDGYNQ